MAGPQPQPPRRRPRPTAIQCVAASVFAMLVVAAIIVILWLVLHPAKVGLSVDHAAAPGLNFTPAGALAGAFDLTLRAYNRNRRAAVLYHSLDVGVWYNGTYLAGAEVPGFVQPPQNETRIDVAASPPPAAAPLPGDVEGGMKRDRSTGGKLPVDVHVRAKVKFRYGVVKTRHYRVRASCPAVSVDFVSPSSFDRVYCNVHI